MAFSSSTRKTLSTIRDSYETPDDFSDMLVIADGKKLYYYAVIVNDLSEFFACSLRKCKKYQYDDMKFCIELDCDPDLLEILFRLFQNALHDIHDAETQDFPQLTYAFCDYYGKKLDENTILHYVDFCDKYLAEYNMHIQILYHKLPHSPELFRKFIAFPTIGQKGITLRAFAKSVSSNNPKSDNVYGLFAINNIKAIYRAGLWLEVANLLAFVESDGFTEVFPELSNHIQGIISNSIGNQETSEATDIVLRISLAYVAKLSAMSSQ